MVVDNYAKKLAKYANVIVIMEMILMIQNFHIGSLDVNQ